MSEEFHDRSEKTEQFMLSQTMLRIKDPESSIPFYRDVLGMTLIKKLDFPEMSFTLFFLGYYAKDKPSEIKNAFGSPGVLELTYNYGTESDPDFAGYHNGNSEPRGFGHIGITVPDVEAACARFERLGVEFLKRPGEGNMKGLAFIRDPDGYLIEVLSVANMTSLLG